MNCANHPDLAAAAYCRTCGKPLCSNCTRDVRGVIYCENCLADRLQGVQPPPPAPGFVAATPREGTGGGGPNPALAGILGAIPFGVGAVYNGQYAKGLAHLVVFSLLVIGANQGSESLSTICGFGIAFFCVYQIIDAVRSAHAIQAGRPAPDPLGLGQAFGAGEKVDTSKVPMAAILLIGVGALFLLQTMGVFEFSAERLWPLFLIALGVWLFARRWGLIGTNPRAFDHRYRMRGLAGPVALVTVGMLSLIESWGGPGWGRTWPVLLLAIGLAQLLARSTPTTPLPPPPPAGGTSANVMAGEVQPPSSEVKHG